MINQANDVKSPVYAILNSFAERQSEFKSTKELYSYAKKRVVGVANKLEREYLIVADTKNNQILAEKIGSGTMVTTEDIFIPEKIKKHVTIIHGHPKKKSRISLSDCRHLCVKGYDKSIVFDQRGRFSLLQILPNTNIELAQELLEYGDLSQKSLLPKTMMKRFFIFLFGREDKWCEKGLKKLLTNEKINLRYISNVFK